MCRLQSVLSGLPGGWLHHDGAAGDWRPALTWEHHPNNPLRKERRNARRDPDVVTSGNIAIDGDRMWATIMETAQIGATPRAGSSG